MKVIGEATAVLNVCINNVPEWPSQTFPENTTTLSGNELSQLIAVNSNHWRKIFNVYAKLLHAINPKNTDDWRQVRDHRLLQAGNQHALTLGTPRLEQPLKSLTLIAGKQFAENLGLLTNAQEIHPGIYRPSINNCLVVPYFDYRALSDKKIAWLADEIRGQWPQISSQA